MRSFYFCSALDTVRSIRRVYHSAGRTAHALLLSLHGLTLELLIWVWLTVRRLTLELLIWIGLTVRRLTVGVAVLERHGALVGTGQGDDKTDKPEEESAAEPASEALIAFVFHYRAGHAAPHDACTESDKADSENV